jgi:hypothetical protein
LSAYGLVPANIQPEIGSTLACGRRAISLLEEPVKILLLAMMSFFLLLPSMFCQEKASMTVNKAAAADGNASVWWKEAVVYQIYPRSLKTEWRRVGDRRGIISKLDYLRACR